MLSNLVKKRPKSGLKRVHWNLSALHPTHVIPSIVVRSAAILNTITFPSAITSVLHRPPRSHHIAYTIHTPHPSASTVMSTAKAFLNECEHTEEEMLSVALWTHMVNLCELDKHNPAKHGGSIPGKAPNIQRDFVGAHRYYMLKYFWPENMLRPGTSYTGPEQPPEAFERRFRMSRPLFQRIMNAVVSHSDYFRQGLRKDAVGRVGISPLLKCICALRQLAYGIPADFGDDMFDVSETTASLCLIAFCRAVKEAFGYVYLRQPTPDDLERIERKFAAVGFPGCIGCLDCAGWDWKNCPKALQGAMIGKDGKPKLRMEVICDLDLWIWGFQFGLPGVLNDLNILEVSEHFSKVLSGEFPPVTTSYTVTSKVFEWLYYLTDGIYPAWKIFIKTISTPTSRKEKLFCRLQEGVRKCVERVFGLLFRRFKILFLASELWSPEKMKDIAEACVILHNQIAEQRREHYCGDRAGDLNAKFSDETDDSDIVFIRPTSSEIPSLSLASDDIKVKGYHRKLTAALIDHIWCSL